MNTLFVQADPYMVLINKTRSCKKYYYLNLSMMSTSTYTIFLGELSEGITSIAVLKFQI